MFVFGGWSNELSIIGKLGEHGTGVKAQRPHQKAALQAAGTAPDGQGAQLAVARETPPPQGLDGPVLAGRSYRWTITRKGGQIDWKIDGQPFLSYSDPEPLYGDDKCYLGFNNWESDVYFDNLSIRPAP